MYGQNQQYVVDEMNSCDLEICPKCKKPMYWYGDWYCRTCDREDYPP